MRKMLVIVLMIFAVIGISAKSCLANYNVEIYDSACYATVVLYSTVVLYDTDNDTQFLPDTAMEYFTKKCNQLMFKRFSPLGPPTISIQINEMRGEKYTTIIQAFINPLVH